MKIVGMAIGIAVAAMTAGCASSSRVDLLAPRIELAQLSTPSQLYIVRGPSSVRYAVRVVNPSSEPITLRQLELRTFGDSPYVLRQGVQYFRQTVAPQQFATFETSVWAEVLRTRLAASEPVIVRGVATFETSEGRRQIVFTQTLRQYERDRME